MKSIINYIKRFILPKPKIVNANFKYQLGQEVFFISSSTVIKGKITQCRINLMEDNSIGFRYGVKYQYVNGESILYLPESLIYSSKEELANSLIND